MDVVRLLPRGLAFVLVQTSVVVAYLVWLCNALPPLRGEDGVSLVITPVSSIAAIVLAVAYPFIVCAKTHSGRVLVFAVAAGLGLLVYGAALGLMLTQPPNLGLAVLATIFGAIYGAPLFLAQLALAKLTSPLLVASPARGWL